MSKRTSVASFLRVKALRPDLLDLATVDVADEELSELSSSFPPGLGDDPPPPPPPPPKLGGGAPFFFLYFFRTGSHCRNSGAVGPPSGGSPPNGMNPSAITSPARFLTRGPSRGPPTLGGATPQAAAGGAPW